MPAQTHNYQQLVQRKRKIISARSDLIDFIEFMHPDPNFPDDVSKTAYSTQRHHRVLAAGLEQVESGIIKRLMVTMPPRSGKTEMVTKTFVPWYLGKNPRDHIIAATYNEKFSWDLGRKIRENIREPLCRQVFPNLKLKQGSAAVDRLELQTDGLAIFAGRGGTVTGRGGMGLIIDDPIKDRKEADSKTVRESLWSWYTQVMLTRLMTDVAWIILVSCMTGDTPVLMADGSEKPLRDIEVGDRVATYRDGKLSTSKILNWINHGPDVVFTIKMTSGKTVKANARHPFLVSIDGKPTWTRLKDLRRGQEILRVSGENGTAKPARRKAATSPSIAGDTVHRTTTGNAGLTAFDRLRSTIARIARGRSNTAMAFLSKNTSDYSLSRMAAVPSVVGHPRPVGRKANFASTIAMTAARFAGFFVMNATSPLAISGHPKSSLPQPNISDFTLDRIASITESGTEDVFDIEVAETENFIANGLVSHNTRWHEDDLCGRISDPSNSCYNEEEALKWHKIDFPAIAGEYDILGRQPGESLWPARFSKEFLMSQKRTDPRGFMALYQGQPTPEDGVFFKAEDISTYNASVRRPKDEDLRFYIGCDFAISMEANRDKTCFLVVGVDSSSTIWIIEAYWRQAPADALVSELIRMIRKYKPLRVFAERGHISKSIGPFLQKRMIETQSYAAVDEITPVADKQSRAQSILGRMSAGKVMFPAFMSWWPEARSELLKFPQGAHDDFVDALAMIGLGLMKMLGARGAVVEKPTVKPFTGQWLANEIKREKNRDAYAQGRQGW